MFKNILDLTAREQFEICEKASKKGGCKFCPLFAIEQLNDEIYCIPQFYNGKDLDVDVEVED